MKISPKTSENYSKVSENHPKASEITPKDWISLFSAHIGTARNKRAVPQWAPSKNEIHSFGVIFTLFGIIFTRFESHFHSLRVVSTLFTLLKSNHFTRLQSESVMDMLNKSNEKKSISSPWQAMVRGKKQTNKHTNKQTKTTKQKQKNQKKKKKTVTNVSPCLSLCF